MKKIAELRQKLSEKTKEARSFVEEGNIEEAEKITKEAEEIRNKIKSLERIEEMEEEVRDVVETEEGEEGKTKAEARSVLFKALAGNKITSEERALLVEGTAVDGQTSGGFIVPEDVKTEINEFRRQYTSLKQYVDVQKTNTNAGSFVFEKTSTLTELADLTEGQDIGETELGFDKKAYAIKDKGALLPVTNNLLQDEAGNLVSYIGRWFSKKAVKTENSDIVKVLKSGKNDIAKPISNIADLTKKMNEEIDPALLDGSIVITNQSGFAVLDDEKDQTGKPLLQPDPTNATRRIFKGLPVVVLSNTNLKSNNGKAPLFLGNLLEAVRFQDRDVYELATSKEAGFTKNITYLRCIERYDAILKDPDAYFYGELTVGTPSV